MTSKYAILYPGSNDWAAKSDTNLSQAIDILQNDPNRTKTLDLRSQQLRNVGAIKLADEWRNNSYIENLDLSNNNGIRDAGLDAIADRVLALPDCRVTRLNFKGNVIHANSILNLVRKKKLSSLHFAFSVDLVLEINAFAEFLSTDNVIRSLSLESCGLDDDAMTTLVAALQKNTVLEELYVGVNPFFDRGARALAKLIESSPTLTAISALNDNLTSESHRALIDAGKFALLLLLLN